jgi:hypothetical protein
MDLPNSIGVYIIWTSFYTPIWCFGMCAHSAPHSFHFQPIEVFVQNFYCGIFTMMSNNWHIMLFLHDSHSQFCFQHIGTWHKWFFTYLFLLCIKSHFCSQTWHKDSNSPHKQLFLVFLLVIEDIKHHII